MFSFFSIVIIILAILLIVIVLMQQSKGSGLTATFGGGSMGSMFGTRRTADFLAKATWGMAAAIAILTILVNGFFLPKGSDAESVIQQGTPTQTAPANPGGSQPAK
ncbi:MAG: preprotein translocase subunit SecG [Ignavibacteriales bacterium]|jgi:preprotein translocase subunit SecG|nr:preprotein translocase subunit SecG [Ignavibacteriales bacterium]MBK7266086.1 preprotein translocase subunit SecG [Ignavibacteriales bacterium]MBK8663993.1 preprotein translocase subunit SecG [Ignavibacteriales bacterium]MBP9122221.1 preprotein translocase subunit SecG [Ignavibacteriaceae bacterium]MCC6637464.1 preprotein translocase subunit SecG [Ignavibacteriaceae bacterium]